MGLFLLILVVDVMAVCCGLLLLWLYRRRRTSASAPASKPIAPAVGEPSGPLELPIAATSRTTCVGGAPLAFRPRSCALHFPEGRRARVLIEGDADLSGAPEFTIHLVLGAHEAMAAEGPAGVVCDIDGVLSVVVSRMRVGFRVCQIAPLESDPYAWSAPLSPGTWYLVSCVFERGRMSVYVDGVALGRSCLTRPTPYCGPIRALQVGAEGTALFSSQYFAGAVAHIEVWRRAFSRAHVAALQLMCSSTAAALRPPSHHLPAPAPPHSSELEVLAGPPVSEHTGVSEDNTGVSEDNTGVSEDTGLSLLYSLEHVDQVVVCDESGNGYHGEMDLDAPHLVLIECAPSSSSSSSSSSPPRPASKHTAGPVSSPIAKTIPAPASPSVQSAARMRRVPDLAPRSSAASS